MHKQIRSNRDLYADYTQRRLVLGRRVEIEARELVRHGLNCVQNFYGVARIVLPQGRFIRVLATQGKH